MELLGSVRWTSNSPSITLSTYYEYRRNGANMEYRVELHISTISGSAYFGYPIYAKVYYDGALKFNPTLKSASPSQWKNEIVWTSDWSSVDNKTSGSTTLSVNLYSGSGNTRNATYEYGMYVAPAYTSITKFNVNKRDETSVSFDWSASDICDYAWYSKDNGASWSPLPSNNIVSGLSAGTGYNFKLRVRRTDSQLVTESGTVYQQTYYYPHPTRITDFVIGDGAYVDVYNPLGRNYKLELISNISGGVIGTYQGTYAGTINGEFKTEDAINKQYASIPNSNSGTYYAKVTYGSNVHTKGNATYSININNALPTFNNFTYKDTNSKIVGITGNDQVLVKGYSNVRVIISSANKMVANKSASPKNYIAIIDTLNKSVDYSTSDINLDLGVINASGNKNLTVTAYDSRNNNVTRNKEVMVYDYNKPIINIDVSRLNNFENQTTLKVKGTYSKLNINNLDKNTITKVQYRYRETGGNWSSWIELSTTVSNGNFTCSDVILSLDNTKSFDFEIQAIDNIDINTNSAKVDIGQAIFFVSSNKKACYINGQEIIMYDVVDTW